MLRIDRNGESGANGKAGQDGANASVGGAGAHGHDGAKGEHGKPASPISAVLSVYDTWSVAKLTLQTGHTQWFALGNKEAAIHLSAVGGHGGSGGHGGRGGDGGNGSHGANATQGSAGTAGGKGGNGGRGGKGGEGGKGGDGKDIHIKVEKSATDLLMLVNAHTQGGNGGSGGRGGQGGNGGAGGQGGASHSWTTVTIVPVGKTVMTVSNHHHSPGGANGSAGSNGASGANGKNGAAGKDGVYSIIVPGMGIYHQRYDISVYSYAAITSSDGIVEPGETFKIKALTFKNTSTMPTPPNIRCSLVPNKWVRFNAKDALIIPSSIAPNATYQFSQPLTFTVRAAGDLLPVKDGIFRNEMAIRFRATLPRVNKAFATVSKHVQRIPIRYPVEMSMVSYAATIFRSEEAPFAIKLRNLSRQSVGENTAGERVLGISLEVAAGIKGKYLQIYNGATKEKCDLSAPLEQRVLELEAGLEYCFAGTLKFTNPKTPAYTQVKLTFKLHLDNLVIQERNFTIQLAETYKYDPTADFVLVTNNRVKRTTVSQWHKIAESLGTRLSVWNTSLYQGLSYTEKRSDGGNFISELNGKVVIILNNSYATDIGMRARATGYLDQMEIFAAADIADISTYVKGSGFDLKKHIIPLKSQDADDAVAGYKESEEKKAYPSWKKPQEMDLKNRATHLNAKLVSASPTSRHMLVFDYHPTKLRTPFLAEWTLGAVQVRPALPRHRAHIAHREHSVNKIDDADIYNIIKLSPFRAKLKYLDHCLVTLKHLTVLRAAILSDLIDELRAYSEQRWRDGYSKKKLLKALVQLNDFAAAYRRLLNPDVKGEEFFADILAKYLYVVMRLPDRNDKMILPLFKRRQMLVAVCEHEISALFRLRLPHAALKVRLAQLDKKWKETDKETLLNLFSTPYQNWTTQYDNHTPIESVVAKNQLPQYVEKDSGFYEGVNLFKSTRMLKNRLKVVEAGCMFEPDAHASKRLLS